MKDKVFIIWSGSNDIAIKISQLLRAKDYYCEVGGNYGNNSQYISVNATVISQMKQCNQAIVLFKKKDDGTVSGNLYFELGYVLSRYGAKKVHCVKHKDEKIELPSDFDNSFVSAIDAATDDEFAKNVVDYFFERQKLSVDENKMSLIGKRYKMREFIENHYSVNGSNCSDYELAQYVLFYTSAGQIFGEEQKVEEELSAFKKHNQQYFSIELLQSVNDSIAFLEMLLRRKSHNNEVYIDAKTFNTFMIQAKDLDKKIVTDNKGPFDEWLRFILEEQMAYACLLYSGEPTLVEKMRLNMHIASVKCGLRSLDSAAALSSSVSSKNNNDNIGLISLLKSYVYRNLFLSYRYIGAHKGEVNDAAFTDVDCEAESSKWLEECLKTRRELVLNYGNGIVDSGIYENFRMEYYLILAEFLTYQSIETIGEMDYYLLKSELSSYIEDVKLNGQKTNVYIEKIANYHSNLSEG